MLFAKSLVPQNAAGNPNFIGNKRKPLEEIRTRRLQHTKEKKTSCLRALALFDWHATGKGSNFSWHTPQVVAGIVVSEKCQVNIGCKKQAQCRVSEYLHNNHSSWAFSSSVHTMVHAMFHAFHWQFSTPTPLGVGLLTYAHDLEILHFKYPSNAHGGIFQSVIWQANCTWWLANEVVSFVRNEHDAEVCRCCF